MALYTSWFVNFSAGQKRKRLIVSFALPLPRELTRTIMKIAEVSRIGESHGGPFRVTEDWREKTRRMLAGLSPHQLRRGSIPFPPYATW